MELGQAVTPNPGRVLRRARWDAVVVGCGVMGASVSYNLARRGLSVLNIERFGVNHEYGSSHGKTRIMRLAYYEDPRYVPLLRRALDSWREVEARAGKSLLKLTGGLMIGRHENALVTGTLKSARDNGLPHEVLTAASVNERFEAFRIGEEFTAVYEPNAGVLFAEECVRAFVGLGSEAGCEFRFAEEVRGWRRASGGYEVETSLGRHFAGKLVFCAGAWTSGLLDWKLPLKVERQVPFWFASGGKDRFTASKMPVFMLEEGGKLYYGIPDVGHGVKVARHHGGETGDPDSVRRDVTEADLSPVRSFIATKLNGLEGPPIASTTCLYTNTPDYHFVVGSSPREEGVVALSACSGHGFKFGSVLGEVAADLVTGGKSTYDLSFLSPGRFRTGTP